MSNRDMAPKNWNPEALAEDIALRKVVRVYFTTAWLDEFRRVLGVRAEVLVGGYRQATGPVRSTEGEALLAVQPELLRRGCSKRWPVRICDRLGDRVGAFGWRIDAFADVDGVLP